MMKAMGINELAKVVGGSVLDEVFRQYMDYLYMLPNLTCTLNIFVRVLCYDLISFGFSCPYHTDCIS